jgi:hypothetical protein
MLETMPKDKDKESGLTEMLGVRVSPDDLARLDALAERLPVATRHSIARAALRYGLDAIERDPLILLGAAPSKKGGKR